MSTADCPSYNELSLREEATWLLKSSASRWRRGQANWHPLRNRVPAASWEAPASAAVAVGEAAPGCQLVSSLDPPLQDALAAHSGDKDPFAYHVKEVRASSAVAPAHPPVPTLSLCNCICRCLPAPCFACSINTPFYQPCFPGRRQWPARWLSSLMWQQSSATPRPHATSWPKL